jgi:hypothetical protein
MWGIIIVGLIVYIVYSKYKNGLSENTANEKIEDEVIKTDLGNPPFKMVFSILTKNELEFYKVLRQAIDGNQYVICPKVRILDLLWVFPNYVKNKNIFLNKVNRKHLDFVICEIDTMKPLYAIELDDKSHEEDNRKERDSFVDKLFEKLNFNVIHMKAQMQYINEEVKEKLQSVR